MNKKGFDEVAEKFEQIVFNEKFDTIVAIANGGIVPAALLNQRLHVDMQLLKLNLRDNNQQQLYDVPVLLEDIKFDVKGKTVLLVEDRVKTGTTLNFAKQLLQNAGATCIKTFAVNGEADYSLFNEACFKFPWIITSK